MRPNGQTGGGRKIWEREQLEGWEGEQGLGGGELETLAVDETYQLKPRNNFKVNRSSAFRNSILYKALKPLQEKLLKADLQGQKSQRIVPTLIFSRAFGE